MPENHSGLNDDAKCAAGDVDPVMLSLLVCPLTKTQLRFDREACELISAAARLAYPVRGGVPILLPSEARSLNDEELRKST